MGDDLGKGEDRRRVRAYICQSRTWNREDRQESFVGHKHSRVSCSYDMIEKTDGTYVSKGGLHKESAGSSHDVTKRQVFSIEDIVILQTPHDATDNSLIPSFSSTSNGDGLRVGCLGASATPAIGFRVSDLHAKATGKIGKVKHISTKDHYRKLRLVL
jgi:hypothetical protein